MWEWGSRQVSPCVRVNRVREGESQSMVRRANFYLYTVLRVVVAFFYILLLFMRILTGHV